MKKKLFIAILIFVPGAAGAFAAFAIDPMAASAIEKLASRALQTDTKLEKARVRWSGPSQFEKLSIANPPGYSEPRAVTIERFEGSVKIRSLLSDTVEVGDLTIVRPELTIEYLGVKSNWTVLMESLGAGKEASRKEKKFRVSKMRVENAVVRFRSDLIRGKTHEVRIPTFEIANVGEVSIAEILAMMLQSMMTNALGPAEGTVPAPLLNGIEGWLK